MKPQLVIDTNVWVAAFRSRMGASRRVIDQVLEGEFDLHLTVPLLMEYEEIFLRERRAMGLTEEEVENLLAFITAVGIRHKVHFLWRWQVPDPDDAHVLEAAVTADCTYLVTFNERDLREAEQFGIAVVRPGALLRILNG